MPVKHGASLLLFDNNFIMTLSDNESELLETLTTTITRRLEGSDGLVCQTSLKQSDRLIIWTDCGLSVQLHFRLVWAFGRTSRTIGSLGSRSSDRTSRCC